MSDTATVDAVPASPFIRCAECDRPLLESDATVRLNDDGKHEDLHRRCVPDALARESQTNRAAVMSSATLTAHQCVVEMVVHRDGVRWQTRCVRCGWHGGRHLSRAMAKVKALEHRCSERFEWAANRSMRHQRADSAVRRSPARRAKLAGHGC